MSPLVSVESKAEGDLIRICRHCIDAIKGASLVHKNPAVICYRCKVKRNPDGIVAGAIHVGMNIEDSTYIGHPDHVDGSVRPGMKSIIASGKVFLDSDTNEVRIDD